MGNLKIRVSLIAARVLAYVAERALPAPDFVGCHSLEATIESLITKEEMTDTEAYNYVICVEEVDPTLDEHVALFRMSEIVFSARVRRGCPGDEMNDAVRL